MSPTIQLILGCFLLSVTIAYAWWSYLRVWLFRQDLFTIRDHLWDTMRADATLDHPAHRECRDSINAIIRVAPFLSPLTVFRLFTVEIEHAAPDPDEIPPAVRAARQQVFLRMTRYLFFESLTGLRIVLFLLSYMSMRAVRGSITRMVQGVFDSPETRDLAEATAEYQLAT